MAAVFSAAAGFATSWWANPPVSTRLPDACESGPVDPAGPSAWRFAVADPAPLGLSTAVEPSVPAARPAAASRSAAPDTRAAVSGIELTGSLRMTASGKSLRAEEAAEAVIYWRPREPAKLEPPAEPLVVTTLRKTFVPRTLPLVAGSRVRFPNEDPILHNVFSTAEGNAFDTGLYGKGEGETVTFPQPGLVRTYCNVHQAMVGHILVLDTPHYTRPDRQGRYRLTLPPGDGELFVWHERATLWRKPMALEPFTTVDVTLDLSRRRVPAHLNKFGKPYRRGGSDYR